jgi:hypothetical protein
MPKRKTSYVWVNKKTGVIYGRVQIKQSNGKYKSIYTEPAKNATHAEELAERLKSEHQAKGNAYLDGRNMTFRQLADWYKEEFVTVPVYNDGVKVAGLRGWEMERRKIDRICAEIGHHLVNSVDESVLRKFKLKRLKTVKISTVNRDLETIKSMLSQAIIKKWRTDAVPPRLVQKSLENRRTVTITDDEARILRAAHGWTGSPRIYALIIALRDSGAGLMSFIR